MWFMILGVVMVLLKLAGVAFMGQFAWWYLTAPFVAAAVWWAIADHFGFTQRRAMAEDAERARKRRERQYESLGMRAPPPGSRPRKPRDRV